MPFHFNTNDCHFQEVMTLFVEVLALNFTAIDYLSSLTHLRSRPSS